MIKHKIVQQKKVIVSFLFVLKFQTFLNNIYFTKNVYYDTDKVCVRPALFYMNNAGLFKKHHCYDVGVLTYVEMQML